MQCGFPRPLCHVIVLFAVTLGAERATASLTAHR